MTMLCALFSERSCVENVTGCSGMLPTGFSSVVTASKMCIRDRLYTTRAFEGSKNARKVLEYAMSDLAVACLLYTSRCV